MARVVSIPSPESANSTATSLGPSDITSAPLKKEVTLDTSLTRDVVFEKYEGTEGGPLSETSKNCVHECVRPADHVRQPKTDRPPAKKFSYKLDPFQDAAIQCLELGESVLVAAHTSAGKTTVAEYAIAMALRDGSRVVYTSPIKALSNQKYRDLAEQFGDVGLMTGDVTLNPEASVIIMTTEILRSILYRGSELVREVRWVVFDEIHYMRDRDRGVVWEESIILLPDSVRQVFLSATIPNTLEFAEWICRVKHQPCHVISTNYRPTPLQHFVFPQGADGVLMVMDEMRNFKEDNFRRALSMLKSTSEDLSLEADRPTKRRKMRNDRRQNDNSDLAKVIGMCHQREYTPVIVFAFSKMEVEENARGLEKADLTTEEEKMAIQEIFTNAVNTLGEEDQKLPQINAILPMLMRGIGIHHGGLLPMVKEITELLFQEMLIKVLFSTETFSMGINMPARTVIFSALSKWDGQKNRMISPGEYIQMSGRAGRRGLDDRGLSIVMVKEDVDADELKSLFTGSPLRLDSHFYLKYNTLLNLLRVDGADPRYMLHRSFYQFQREKKTVNLEEDLRAKQIERQTKETIENILHDVCEEVGLSGGDIRDCLPPEMRQMNFSAIDDKVLDFFGSVSSVVAMKEQVRQVCYTEENVLRFFQRGRIVHVVDNGVDWGYGIVLSLKRERSASNPRETEPIAMILLECSPSWDPRLPSKLSNAEPNAPGILDNLLFGSNQTRDLTSLGQFEIFPCRLECIAGVTGVKANITQSPGASDEFRKSCGLTLQAIQKQVGLLKYLDPVEDLKLPREQMERLLQDDELTLKALKMNPLYGWQYAKHIFKRFQRRIDLETAMRGIESALQTSRDPQNLGELKGMEEVLRRLGYIDENNIVTFKGRVACDISTVDELIIGEILFDNVKVSELDINYLCAMLSCLVHEDRPETEIPEDPKLAELYTRVQEVAKRVATISIECRLELDQEKYLKKFCPTVGVSVSTHLAHTLPSAYGRHFDVDAGSTICRDCQQNKGMGRSCRKIFQEVGRSPERFGVG
eukprot:Blabericola_migrator_1__2031@NODE_1554_length_4294_cov_81_630471_g1019_i0_p1_GENE_NODE_1554_length_4294_cov_81_630471_g1019_i0NODE_1554_length_4294_cov_81_630471_g1019_i0_p1_ORF_typecomplete_len1035_score206_49rRNA_procarch/PF13234_6/7_2e33DEAD/PF00270_29/7_4e26DEAD/PF00270_29/4_7e03DSHCT/PF08148_12/2_6e15Helicase_C/PF00271_31/7_6e12ResIII/PF04851_15/8_8e11ResIII/PF04851_15/7_7e02Flavi_DEAD/PF07652_14/1_6e10Flavi_DEAD/PF07652_14/6_6e03AAA_16/PF13191_6/0_015DUF3638/PF12340_8/0_022AAA_19/PF13245_6